MNFCRKLKECREQKELTQKKVSELIPMNQSNYSKIERGIQEPNLYQLKRIAEILDVSLDYLLEVNINITDDKMEHYFLSEVKLIYEKCFFKH